MNNGFFSDALAQRQSTLSGKKPNQQGGTGGVLQGLIDLQEEQNRRRQQQGIAAGQGAYNASAAPYQPIQQPQPMQPQSPMPPIPMQGTGQGMQLPGGMNPDSYEELLKMRGGF